MTVNNNTAVSEKIRNGLKINQATDEVPTQVAKTIVPVFEVNPDKEIQIALGNISDSTTPTAIHTSHATKRTFIVGGLLTYSKDANNLGTMSRMLLIPKGKGNIDIIRMRHEPSTAGSSAQSLTLPYPIEIDKNSDIQIINGEATASVDLTGIVYYYEVD